MTSSSPTPGILHGRCQQRQVSVLRHGWWKLDDRGFASELYVDYKHASKLAYGYNQKHRKAMLDRWPEPITAGEGGVQAVEVSVVPAEPPPAGPAS